MKIDSFSGEHRFLSNFWPVSVQLDGREYPTVENAYQAAKTKKDSERIQFLDLTAGQAKRLGSKLILRKDWDRIKVPVMNYLLRQKFSVPYLRDLLIQTGDAELIEGNDWGDTFWGVCNNVGQNHLGKLLMEIRSDIS